MSSPTSCTRYVIDRFGGVEQLRLVRGEALPVPGPGEARVVTQASSVQFTDTIIRRGKYPDAGKPPLTPGYDVVGTIDMLGPGVVDWSIGERVADMCTIGANASHVVLPVRGLTRVPAALDAAEACGLILSGVTAYQMLFRHARIARGSRVLIQGGNGGVGWFATQLAVSAGARVWATARPEHHAALRACGATPIDYRAPDYPTTLRQAAGAGMDWVFDGIGADDFRPSLAALARTGKLVFIGTSEAVNQGRSMIAAGAKLLLRNLLPWSPRISLYSVTGLRKRHPAWFQEDLALLFERLLQGTVQVRIDRRIGFEAVPDAHRALEHGGVSGKIILIPDS